MFYIPLGVYNGEGRLKGLASVNVRELFFKSIFFGPIFRNPCFSKNCISDTALHLPALILPRQQSSQALDFVQLPQLLIVLTSLDIPSD